MKLLSFAIQKQVFLGCLAGITSIVSFQVWQYNHAQYEKRLASARNNCGVYIELGEDAVRFSPSLKAVKYQNKVIPGLKQPGVNSESAEPGDYVMILRSQSSTLPPNALPFDDPFFTSLLNKEASPKTLMVSVVDFDKAKKQATVKSYCTQEPFLVDMDNLYERFQTVDRSLQHSDFDILF
ncbi:hypothetical protein [Nostoc sp. 'Peltigera membranacea cyanobiont' N6]|uniref:hypothetical protein n=1 Tax=Nostoc sp. 'Peltigera membranacea cyanobiont' N6 TaxID=1261031 RepID=UPI000CF31E03|nr:hypothetical protein [Nostoc sp. 'Peltigera membranacea cyanobiont' N6]AVH63953.1 hypothetical protein NPM_2227 [Nostoc sp. 'Peltigera membranacea cyanobiont' N6]